MSFTLGDGGLRWNLLEKFGLIGIKAPKAAPSRFTASGKESAAWRAVEQECAEWKAIVIELQKRLATATAEVVRLANRPPPEINPGGAAASSRKREKHRALGKCIDCGKKIDGPRPRSGRCALCMYRGREACRRYYNRRKLQTGQPPEKEQHKAILLVQAAFATCEDILTHTASPEATTALQQIAAARAELGI